MPDKPDLLDADAAMWDGKTWTAAGAAPPPGPALAGWDFRPLGGASKAPVFVREQMIGNALWGPAADGKVAPRYYVKEVYAPVPLAFGQGGKRLWLSEFTGLVRVDLPVSGAAKCPDRGGRAGRPQHLARFGGGRDSP